MNLHLSGRGPARVAAGVLSVVAIGASALAQTNEAPSRHVGVRIESGVVRNTGTQVETVSVLHVSEPGAAWMRLYFDDVLLAGNVAVGNGTVLKITSLTDGYFQYLDARTIREWSHSSAYFNGDLLELELIAHPGTGPNRISVVGIDVGMNPTGEDTICGVDNRVASNDPRNARLLPIGCTAFLIDDACGCFGTAGHCISGSVVQFNVPLSNSNGSLNNPPPQDQYAVDTSSRQSTNGGQGNDWGYFGCFPNSTTGLTPKQAQGQTYVLTTPPAWNSSLNVRITGYGVDGGTANQTQQTHVGPWVSYSGGNLLQYQADTQGGNSGSPVLQEESGVVMGVHTHGGCTTSGTGSNKGTSRVHPGWTNALANPRGVCKKSTPSCGVTPFTAIRNGSGVNPICLTNVTDPALGTEWQFAVDTGVVAGGSGSIVRARQPGGGEISSVGEHLLDPTSRTIFIRSANGTGVNVHTVAVPPILELAGYAASLQGLVLVGSEPRQLCNALDFVLGCAQ